MLDFNDIRTFCKVAERGSLAGAADALSMPASTVSRRIAALESEVGVALLHRSTRRLSLTDDGRRLYEAMGTPIRDLLAAEQAFTGGLSGEDKPQGILRVTAPPLFASCFLAPIASRYMARYPQTQVEIVASRSRLDLIDEGLDLAIRAGALPDSNLVARPLKPLRQVLVASPTYLDTRGEPAHPEALVEHDLIVFNAGGSRRAQWRFSPGVDLAVQGRLGTSSYDQALHGALAGIGIALLPLFLVQESLATGRLRSILAGSVTERLPLHLIYPSRRLLSVKVRAFIDLMLAELGPDGETLEADPVERRIGLSDR